MSEQARCMSLSLGEERVGETAEDSMLRLISLSLLKASIVTVAEPSLPLLISSPQRLTAWWYRFTCILFRVWLLHLRSMCGALSDPPYNGQVVGYYRSAMLAIRWMAYMAGGYAKVISRCTPTVPISHSPNSKPLLPHLNARYLILNLNHWHLLEIWHSGVLCRARCAFCTHFGRENVHFWSCPDRTLLQYVSMINVV